MDEPKENLQYVPIGSEDELNGSERLYVEIDGQNIVVFRIGTDILAIGDICIHDDGPLGDGDIDDTNIICPRHGARFDVKTGKALTLPAVEDIPVCPVRVSDGQIEIGVLGNLQDQ